MIPKFRAWHKTWEEMGQVKRISFDDDGNVTTVLFIGKDLGVNAKIDEFEIMQSTGLKDKNGKEIFEGDVLQIDFIKAIVRFGQYRYYDNAGKDVLTGNGFYLECLNFMDPDCISPYETDVLDKAEIIGNIYENPEYDQNFVGFRIKGE